MSDRLANSSTHDATALPLTPKKPLILSSAATPAKDDNAQIAMAAIALPATKLPTRRSVPASPRASATIWQKRNAVEAEPQIEPQPRPTDAVASTAPAKPTIATTAFRSQ